MKVNEFTFITGRDILVLMRNIWLHFLGLAILGLFKVPGNSLPITFVGVFALNFKASTGGRHRPNFLFLLEASLNSWLQCLRILRGQSLSLIVVSVSLRSSNFIRKMSVFRFYKHHWVSSVFGFWNVNCHVAHRVRTCGHRSIVFPSSFSKNVNYILPNRRSELCLWSKISWIGHPCIPHIGQFVSI